MGFTNSHANVKRAILYDIILPQTTRREAEKRLIESENLLKTYGGIVDLKIIQRRHHASSTSFIGKDKLEEIYQEGKGMGANLLIANGSLKAKQIYGIEHFFEEKEYKIQIWDRVSLIIQIFSQHASTAESKLQLELAKLNHLGPRIYGMGDELSQQGGGIGTRGLGETNTEIMKRHISQRKKLIVKKIKKLQYSRRMIRNRREKNGFKTISIVGYTNAGKSHLFQSLTGRGIKVKDDLFVTLDTTTARLYLNSNQTSVLISDTIGFISNLPPQLLEAFKSTLEEVLHANLLIHLIDSSDPDFLKKIQVVKNILHELNCSDLPTIYVFNKTDLIKHSSFENLDELMKEVQALNGILISAKEKIGLDKLKKVIATKTSYKTPS